jgi:predicted GNAT family N-acyltransferase
MPFPAIGSQLLLDPDRHHNRTDISVRVVRSLDDLQRVAAMRALTYMAEQDCPYDEEFDGNDLCALHLIAFEGNEPVATLRMRFFDGFCKLERACIHPKRRGGAILSHLLTHAFEIAARKGYRRAIAYIQSRLEGMWRHVAVCRAISPERTFGVSNSDYIVMELELPDHPEAIRFDSDPYVVLRPEGDWDTPGVLDPKPTQPKHASA